MWDCKNYFRWSSSWEVWPELAMPCWCHWIVFKNRIQILKCTLLQCRHNSEASAGEACRMCVILCMPILVAPRVNYRSLNGRDYFLKFRRTRLFAGGANFWGIFIKEVLSINKTFKLSYSAIQIWPAIYERQSLSNI